MFDELPVFDARLRGGLIAAELAQTSIPQEQVARLLVTRRLAMIGERGQ
jgi:hypothetical protein